VRMYVRVGLLVLGMMLTAACNERADRQPLAQPSADSLNSLGQPRRIEHAGTYVHHASGMTLPTAAGRLGRTAIIQFDEDGLDVGAEYRVTTAEGNAAVTVYIYPMSALPPAPTADESCRMEFEEVKRSIVLRFPDATLVDEWNESVPRPTGTRNGLAAAYEVTANMFGGPREPIGSEAYLFCAVRGSWAVKYRVSYAKALLDASMAADVIAAAPADVLQ
jgi:hypothetical protein